METTMLIGIGMLIVFLLAVIVEIWRDTQKEKHFWDNWKK